MKKYYAAIVGVGLYLSMIVLENFLWVFPVIPHYGFDEYSLAEKAFLFTVAAIPAVLAARVMRRKSFRDFIINAAVFWFFVWLLCKGSGLRHWIAYSLNHDVHILGVDFLNQDIWFNFYVGCVAGTILAGSIMIILNKKSDSKK